MYDVAISGIRAGVNIHALASTIADRPANATVTLGISTGYQLPAGHELLRRPGLYLPMTDIADTLLPVDGVRYLAHFTPGEGDMDLQQQVSLLYQQAGPLLDGVQINDPKRLTSMAAGEITTAFPGKELVFPLGRQSMRWVNQSNGAIRSRLIDLVRAGVTTLLLDNSSGRGQPLATAEVQTCVRSLHDVFAVNLRVAGRLGKEGVQVPRTLVRAMPGIPLGWEVESLLRTEGDAFDPTKAINYLKRSFYLIRTQP